MTALSDEQQECIDLHLSIDVKDDLELAASLAGQTVNDFILSSALERARKIIENHKTMDLSMHEAELFFEALNKPVRFNEMLEAAIQEHEGRAVNK